MQNSNDARIEPRRLEPLQSSHCELPSWLVIAGTASFVMKALRAIDAQAHVGVGSAEKLDPLFFYGNAIRLHREAGLRRRRISKTPVGVLVPGDGRGRRLAGVPDHGRRRFA